jgi:surface antigen
MRRSCNAAFLAVLALPLLAGCDTKEQSYGAGGAALGALACGAAGAAIFHTTAGALGSAAACGAVGYLVGSSIGRKLDEQDRARAAAATQAALAQPVYYPHNTTNVVRPRPHPVTWKSDHGTGNSGTAAVVAVQPQPSGGECRTVREVAYIKGQETTQESKYCRSADGSWTSA